MVTTLRSSNRIRSCAVWVPVGSLVAPLFAALLITSLLLAKTAAVAGNEPVAKSQDSNTSKISTAGKTKADKRSGAGKSDDNSGADEVSPEIPPPVEYEAVKLADGTEVQVEKWGETFLGYDYVPPLAFGDHRLQVIVDYERLGHHNAAIASLQIDEKREALYWCDDNQRHGVGHLWRAHTNGGGATILASHLADPRGLWLDTERSKLYWLEGMATTANALMVADANGKNGKALVDRLKTPYALGFDPKRGELYYHCQEDHRIVRVKNDGTDETPILSGSDVGPNTNGMAFDTSQDRLYWAVVDLGIRSASRDGSGMADVIEYRTFGRAEGFTLDSENRKLYFADAPYGRIERANLDGSQREAVAAFPVEDRQGWGRFIGGGLAVDHPRKRLYFSGIRGKAVTGYAIIYSMPLPPVRPAVRRPSPPLVLAINPGEQGSGGEISLKGERLGNTTAISFIDDSTCQHVPAKFHVVDDRTLAVKVPRLAAACAHPVIVVQTSIGVTMTLNRDLKPVGSNAKYEHDRLAAGKLPQLWLMPGSLATNVEVALAYVERDALIAADGKGANTIFAKNGSAVRLSYLADSVIYHEPFAMTTRTPDMARPSETEANIKFVPVPAIRASFLDALFTYAGARGKGVERK
jgi:hypothetical protein